MRNATNTHHAQKWTQQQNETDRAIATPQLEKIDQQQNKMTEGSYGNAEARKFEPAAHNREKQHEKSAFVNCGQQTDKWSWQNNNKRQWESN